MTVSANTQAGHERETPEHILGVVRHRLSENSPVRRNLPELGRIHVDRQIPFLCIYRRPRRGGAPGAEKLVTSEAAYLVCSGKRRLYDDAAALVRAVAESTIKQFGACLLLELWETPDRIATPPKTATVCAPEFKVVATRGASQDEMTHDLVTALARIKLDRKKATVSAVSGNKSCPRSMRPFLSATDAADLGCLLYGIEIAPIYRSPDTGEVFPGILRGLRRVLTIALRRAFFDFTCKHTTHQPAHYHVLGRRAVVKAVWDVDRMLAAASDQFDLLLHITPVNVEQAWRTFRRSHHLRIPKFHYRPLPAEPAVLKRDLFKAPVERIEDPALAWLFREKMDEVDRQITMLQDRDTPRFLQESIQLYGAVEPELLDLAVTILEQIPARCRQRTSRSNIGPEEVAKRAREEIAYLRPQCPTLNSTVEIRPDVTGIMVSRGNLLISDHLQIPKSRMAPLLQHEIGTHVVTYHNGRNQPFRQLYTGLAGYDALQEGLAVLSEYLVGGLDQSRLRLLAGRVVAVQCLLQGATFIETFEKLASAHGFSERVSFMITMRVYRGGGLTKDAVYLRGLRQILGYFKRGGRLEDLLVGKVAIQHMPIVRELLWRGVLKAPQILPRYMALPEMQQRLEFLRGDVAVLDLIKKKRRCRK